MVYPSYLFLSLFQPQIRLNLVEGKEIHCLITDNWFVTVRQGDSTAVDDAYNRVVQNPDSWHSGVAYFLYLTSQFVIDGYYPLMDRISGQLNVIEEKLLNGSTKSDARKSVYRIKQQLINLRQMVAPQREVFSSVIGEKRVAEDSDIRDLFRHLYERLLRVYDVIDSQRDLSSNVLDMMENQESRKLAEAVSRLTILSMIFLPLTFFTGLFQLNFATTTDQMVLPISGDIMFTVVMAAMIFSVAAMMVVFRRRGWL
jgi:magnesium transporter